MSAAINRRQQARNERALQDLIKNVSGNNRCADCNTPNPGWASFNLGIFLCLKCASIHRKLGTHISKVKSLSMDSWSVDQVDHMTKVGNVVSNRIYNPRNAKPAIPIDVDEVDGVMERFIRKKYEQKTLSSDSETGSRNHTGSTSSEDRAPPPPPKPNKHFSRFGLRSATANFPLSRHGERSPPLSPLSDDMYGDRSPPRNKPAKVLGADIGSSRDDNIKAKLAQLRDMGFPDEKRNMAVLKGLNGRVDKAVEELIRLGEGGSSSRLPSRSATASTPKASASNGLTIEKSRPAALTPGRGLSFENMQKSLPPSPLSPEAGLEQHSLNRAVTPAAQTNPFLQQPPQQQSQFSLAESMQQMQLAQQPPQQASQLFPNQTGGYNQQGQAHNPFMQSYQQAPQYQLQQSQPTQMSGYYNPMMQQSQPVQWQSTPAAQDQNNPFLRTSRSQVFTPSTNPFEMSNGQLTQAQTSQPSSQLGMGQQLFQPVSQQHTSNPFQQSNPYQPAQAQQYVQQAQQNSQSFWQNSQISQQTTAVSPPALTASPAPFQYQSAPNSLHQPGSAANINQHKPFQQSIYPPVGHDKPSILALYGQQSFMNGTSPFAPSSTMGETISQPQRSVTMPPAVQSAPSPFGPPSTQSLGQSSGASLFGSLAPPSAMSASPFAPSLSSQATGFNNSTSPFAAATSSHPFTPSSNIAQSPAPLQPSNNPFDGTAAAAFSNSSPFAQPNPTPSANATWASSTKPFAGGSSPFTSAPPQQNNANTFTGTYTQPAAPNPAIHSGAFRHVSNESMDVRAINGMNGRHSPDAFASLSSKLR